MNKLFKGSARQRDGVFTIFRKYHNRSRTHHPHTRLSKFHIVFLHPAHPRLRHLLHPLQSHLPLVALATAAKKESKFTGNPTKTPPK